ncbi:MAG: purine-nucleoside phosphorylase [Deltaproteobacteria bacterium]|nr:purine-nucleoside phosphorylase [Deltaproteobacteria bacterium]
MTASSSAIGFEHIQAATAFLRERFGIAADQPIAKVGIVLGSGLGAFADEVMEQGGQALAYDAIPHFPTSSVVGHKGRMVFGDVDGVPVLLMQGRVHFYEGYSEGEVTFPIRVLGACGVENLMLTNAAGGMADGMEPGDLMLITDHLNLTGSNPLIGGNDDRLGPRFPDMSTGYESNLNEMVRGVAAKLDVKLKEGIYAGMLGPSYETPAEIRYLKTIGADAVGMSTVYECIVANHQGMKVCGISCITNLAAGISNQALSHDEVKETADRTAGVFCSLVRGALPGFGRT